MPEALTITVKLRWSHEDRGKCQIFRFSGLLDAFSKDSFVKAMQGFIETGSKNFIIDLYQIDFVDSSGLGVLASLHNNLKTQGGSLQIITNTRVTQTIQLVRLDKILSLQSSVDAAVNSL